MDTIALSGNIKISNNTTNSILKSHLMSFSDPFIKEWDVRKICIAASTTDLDVGLGELTNVSFVYIESTQPISVKVSGQDLASSKGKVFLYTGSVGGYITELLISNGELVTSEVLMILGGVG